MTGRTRTGLNQERGLASSGRSSSAVEDGETSMLTPEQNVKDEFSVPMRSRYPDSAGCSADPQEL